jgi:hypothetical protein
MPIPKQIENGLSPPLIENGCCNLLKKTQKPLMKKRKRTPCEWFKKYFWEGKNKFVEFLIN